MYKDKSQPMQAQKEGGGIPTTHLQSWRWWEWVVSTMTQLLYYCERPHNDSTAGSVGLGTGQVHT